MDDVESLLQSFPTVKFVAGTAFFADERYDSFFYLKSGSVELSYTNEEGQTTQLHVFYPGACISLLSLIEPTDSYDFTALTDGEAYKIPRETFIQLLHDHSELSFEFLLRAMKGMKGLLYRVQHGASASAYQQVAGMLVYFARHLSDSGQGPHTLSLHITHQKIAEWLGLSRENVSIQMKKLERGGFIDKEGDKIVICDLDALEQVST